MLIRICTLDKTSNRKPLAQAFQDYRMELFKKLPMNNSVFMKLLDQQQCFSGNQKATLIAEENEADKASYLLDNIIGHDRFVKLLDAMELFGDTLATLAQEIKGEVGVKSCKGTLNMFVSSILQVHCY